MRSAHHRGVISTGCRLTGVEWRGRKEKAMKAKEKKQVLGLTYDHTVHPDIVRLSRARFGHV